MSPRQAAESIRVLHVDDEPALVDVVAAYFAARHDAISVRSTTSAPEALALLEEGAVDCVVSDYQMPRMDGLALFDAVRESHPDLPFILFTGKGGEETETAAAEAGVTEVLEKGGKEQYALLADRISAAVA